MARLARVVVPGFPHHITQRGNRRQQTFFCDEDFQRYLELMAEWCNAHEVEILAYCLMPNHVHLIAVPQSSDGLGRAIGEAHRRYTRMVNFREGSRGHGTDQRLGVSFGQQDGSAVGGWTEYGVIGAYADTARHAVKCAEWCRTQDVAWRSSPRTGRAGFRLR